MGSARWQRTSCWSRSRRMRKCWTGQLCPDQMVPDSQKVTRRETRGATSPCHWCPQTCHSQVCCLRSELSPARRWCLLLGAPGTAAAASLASLAAPAAGLWVCRSPYHLACCYGLWLLETATASQWCCHFQRWCCWWKQQGSALRSGDGEEAADVGEFVQGKQTCCQCCFVPRLQTRNPPFMFCCEDCHTVFLSWIKKKKDIKTHQLISTRTDRRISAVGPRWHNSSNTEEEHTEKY